MRSEYNTQLAKMSFGKIFDLTTGVYFYSYNVAVGVHAGHIPGFRCWIRMDLASGTTDVLVRLGGQGFALASDS